MGFILLIVCVILSPVFIPNKYHDEIAENMIYFLIIFILLAIILYPK